MPEIGELLCAKCQVPLEGVADPNPKSRVSCPRCGVSDTFKNVREEAEAYYKESVARSILESFATGVRGKGRLTFKPKRSPKRVYRFKVRLD